MISNLQEKSKQLREKADRLRTRAAHIELILEHLSNSSQNPKGWKEHIEKTANKVHRREILQQ